MQPNTHFMAGLFFGLAVSQYFHMSLWYGFLAGLIAMFIDIDHLISYYLHYKKISIIGCWNACCGHHFSGGRMFIHHKNGFLIITAFLVVLYVASPFWAFLIAVAYYSHYALDHRIFNSHIHNFDDETIHAKPFGYVFDISWREVILEILFMFGSIWIYFFGL
jgi:hypothetical protein